MVDINNPAVADLEGYHTVKVKKDHDCDFGKCIGYVFDNGLTIHTYDHHPDLVSIHWEPPETKTMCLKYKMEGGETAIVTACGEDEPHATGLADAAASNAFGGQIVHAEIYEKPAIARLEVGAVIVQELSQ